jgi:hypothetical protein
MSLAISKQGSATPGEYAKDKSLCVAYFLEWELLEFFPGVAFACIIMFSLYCFCPFF